MRNLKQKICFQSKTVIWNKFNLNKLNRKKWNVLKKQIQLKKKNIITKQSIKKLYKQRLIAKQQLSAFYGFLPYHILKKYFKNKQFNNSISIIEKRLDVVLFRLQIVDSIFHARQLIKHKKIKINGNIVNSNNYKLNINDIIEFPIKYKSNFNINSSKHIESLKNFSLYKNDILTNNIKYPFYINKQFVTEYFN